MVGLISGTRWNEPPVFEFYYSLLSYFFCRNSIIFNGNTFHIKLSIETVCVGLGQDNKWVSDYLQSIFIILDHYVEVGTVITNKQTNKQTN